VVPRVDHLTLAARAVAPAQRAVQLEQAGARGLGVRPDILENDVGAAGATEGTLVQ
jgi:hypothetical protein